MTQIVKISGLTCGACQRLIAKRIKTINGVADAVVALTGKTEITAQKMIDKREIAKVLEGTKYAVE